MALSYILDIATQLTAPRVAAELRPLVGDPDLTTEELMEGVVAGRETWVRVGEAKPRPWNVVATDLGFTPTTWVVFRLSKQQEIGPQLDDVVRWTVGLLDHVPGDAVLHFDYEVVWLVRRDGELSLNERDDIWTPSRLAAVGNRPHRRGTPVFS
ncbi:SitI3 family protein [Lentzea flava]|uniref:Uncharacterized protein n=1 Tax=Lentzea flava TaxID=103732 RepID=A0ABQ2V323_9PSEU|nr:SitI3 family protein [Lentzea flava]MCP2203237.1 hypothetical protein [Lentzea flava]GGU66663.1 hypothetical protein GCM10010178_68140 [Lentzea flava]